MPAAAEASRCSLPHAAQETSRCSLRPKHRDIQGSCSPGHILPSMDIYSLCTSALSASPQEAYISQSVCCALLAACSLAVCCTSLLLFRRVANEDATGRAWSWAKRLFDVFMFQIVSSAGIVSVNQFRRVFLVLAAAAGAFQSIAWVLFFMVHDEKFVNNRSNPAHILNQTVKFEVSGCSCAERLLLRHVAFAAGSVAARFLGSRVLRNTARWFFVCKVRHAR